MGWRENKILDETTELGSVERSGTVAPPEKSEESSLDLYRESQKRDECDPNNGGGGEREKREREADRALSRG